MSASRKCACGCGEPTKIAKMTNRRWNRVAGEPVKFLPGHNTRLKPKGDTRGWHEPWWYEARAKA
jgi:hypothetical protein